MKLLESEIGLLSGASFELTYHFLGLVASLSAILWESVTTDALLRPTLGIRRQSRFWFSRKTIEASGPKFSCCCHKCLPFSSPLKAHPMLGRQLFTQTCQALNFSMEYSCLRLYSLTYESFMRLKIECITAGALLDHETCFSSDVVLHATCRLLAAPKSRK